MTAVGDPNQAIYGWRGASVSNILDFADTFPRRPAATVADATRSPSTGAPTAGSSRSPTGWPRRSTTRTTPGRAARAQARGGRRRRRDARCYETHAEELAWLADAVRAAHDAGGARGPTSASSPATTRTPPRSSTRSPPRASRSRSSASPGCCGCPRWPRSSRSCTCCNDVTANAVAAHPAHRAALGDRPARPAAARPTGRASSPGARAAAATPRRRPTSSSRSPTASTRPRSPRLDDALDRPGRRAVLPRGAASASRCSPPSCGCCARTSASRCSTSSAGSSTPPGVDVELASAVSPAAAARRDNLDLFVKAVAEFQAVDGDVTPAGPAGLPHRRGRPGQRPRRRHPDRGRLGQAADRAPRQGPGVGARCSWSGCARRGSRPTARARCGPPRPAVLPAPLRGDAARPAAAARPRQGGARRLPRRHPRPRPGGGAPARLRRLHPRRPPASASSSYLLEPAGDAVRPVGLPGRRPRPARGLGRAASTTLAGQAREGRPATPTTPTTRRARGREPGPGREARCGSRPRPGRAPRPTRRRPTTTSTWSRPPGSPTGTPSSSGCSPRRGADRAQVVDVPLPSVAVGDRAGAPARRPRGVRPRAGPADAAAAVAGRAVRHPVPRLGRGAVRPAAPARPRRAARPGRRRHRRRRRPRRADRDLRERARSPTACPHAVEAPFALVLDGQVVRGRIDAVYAEADGGFLVVDWKTNRSDDADPLQLALYRLAWAELAGVPLEQVPRRVPLRAHRRARSSPTTCRRREPSCEALC